MKKLSNNYVVNSPKSTSFFSVTIPSIHCWHSSYILKCLRKVRVPTELVRAYSNSFFLKGKNSIGTSLIYCVASLVILLTLTMTNVFRIHVILPVRKTCSEFQPQEQQPHWQQWKTWTWHVQSIRFKQCVSNHWYKHCCCFYSCPSFSVNIIDTGKLWTAHWELMIVIVRAFTSNT